MQIISSAAESAACAASVADTHGVYLVPAFTGLGAPWWDAEARGLICGLTRDASRAHVVRAALESVAYQTEDLLEAMRADQGLITTLRVDGGMAANDWFCQFLSDQLAIPVERPRDVETTVRGAAMLAALGSGLCSHQDVASWWTSERVFTPGSASTGRTERRQGWLAAVKRCR
jgi:glycerol kinase